MWDCSVCTYRNTAEAFKCLMCDVRKGTSTRKPRLNAQLVAQQLGPSSGRRGAGGRLRAGAGSPTGGSSSAGGEGGEGRGGRHSHHGSGGRPRLKNVDRSSGQQRAVTVNNVTVIITEFQPKRLSDASCSSTDGAHSDGGGHAEAR